MITDPKPCPFCGGHPTVTHFRYGHTGDDYVRISCCKAEADGRYDSWNNLGENPNEKSAYQVAVHFWNTRVTK